MLVPLDRQNVARRTYQKPAYPVTLTRITGNPIKDTFYRVRNSLKRAEAVFEDRIHSSPMGSLPFLLAIPLFILLTGIFSPVFAPNLDFRLPNSLSFPQDTKKPLFLANVTSLEKLYQPGDVAEEETKSSGATAKKLEMTNYKVKPGDNMSILSQQFGITLSTLIAVNNIKNVRRLTIGQELTIPNLDGILYTVKAGDSLSSIARRYEVDYDSILMANNLTKAVITTDQKLFLPGATMSSWDLRQALGELFTWPTRGALTSYFGTRPNPFTGVYQFHNGLDIANAPGTPIRAAMEGRVVDMGYHALYGNYIIINHDGGFQTLYGHLLRFGITRGAYVNQGQYIAAMGTTGYSTGPHLHFSLFRRNVPLNPLFYLH